MSKEHVDRTGAPGEESPNEAAETQAVKLRDVVQHPRDITRQPDAVAHGQHVIVDPFAPEERVVMSRERLELERLEKDELQRALEDERRENGKLRERLVELEGLLKPNAVG